MRPTCIIEHNSELWNPWMVKDIAELDKVQRRCIKLCTSNITFEPLANRRKKTDLHEAYKQICGNNTTNSSLVLSTSNTRGDALKLEHQSRHTNIRSAYFSHRVVDSWNSLGDATALVPTLTSFKDRIEQTTQKDEVRSGACQHVKTRNSTRLFMFLYIIFYNFRLDVFSSGIVH